MLKIFLHRITVVWCLYGLVRLCIFLNPLVFRLMKVYKPLWDDNSAYEFLEDESWNAADPEQIMLVWFCVVLAIGVLVAISAGIHHFSNWFFNTNAEEE